jgi:hypothetical protein
LNLPSIRSNGYEYVRFVKEENYLDL